MKHFILIYLFFFCVAAVSAQIETYGSGSDFYTSIDKAVPVDDSLVLLAIRGGEALFDLKPSVLLFNTNTKTYEVLVERDYETIFYDLYYFGEGKFGILTALDMCDVGSPRVGGLEILNLSGEIIQSHFDDYFGILRPYGSHILSPRPGLYLLISPFRIFFLDENFNPIGDTLGAYWTHEHQHDVYEVIDAKVIHESVLAVEYAYYDHYNLETLTRLALINISNPESSQFNELFNYQETEWDFTLDKSYWPTGDGENNYVYFALGDYLVRNPFFISFPPNHDLTYAQIDLQLSHYDYFRLAKIDSLITILGVRDTVVDIIQTTTALDSFTLQEWCINGQEKIVDFIAYQDDGLLVYTNEASLIGRSYDFNEQTYLDAFGQTFNLHMISSLSSLPDTAAPVVDISLRDIYIQPENITATNLNSPPFCRALWAFEYQDVRLKIINTGSTPIHSFHIAYAGRAERECSIDCGGLETSLVPVEGIQLAPQDSIEFWFPMPIQNIRSDQDSTFCIWLTSPNESVDKYPKNNYACIHIDFRAVSTDELPITSQQIKYFSTPAAIQVLEAPRSLLRVYNLSGQLIRSIPIYSEAQTIDVSNLPSNQVYVASLHTPQQRKPIAMKFLKQ